MKAHLLSLVVGFVVGTVYAAVRVKNPAPPLVALIGLLGMVLGKSEYRWFAARFPDIVTAFLVGGPRSVKLFESFAHKGDRIAY